ncbi:ABC transporter permease [Nonomuraea roseoviolacea subsp. roseoviolacea]|uniref:Transport permease protein n=1 Tax=Nonomuraea roseoviolacea subsp. carminata TaxID=160689 RepID=A0ABT1KFB9_9ACTN|nr:ABC transporter permease [Nonomuraea roseoviolacea]MCP2352329.1 ABC-2 type transport system permease protein [Nonomuraea roseoviolacea subsp. carminata]
MTSLPLPHDMTLAPLSFAARRSRVLGVVRRDFAALRRSPIRIFEILFWPTVELLLWGFVTLFLRTQRVPFVVAFLLGAVLLWQVLQKASNEISIAFLEDIWSRNLLNVQVSPLSSTEYLVGLVLFSLGKVVFAVAVMAGLAYALYGFGVTSLGVGLVPFMGVLLLLGWSLGLVGIAAVLRFGENAQVIAWSLVFVVQPLAGIFYPVSVLPAPLQAVSWFLPASHVFEGMRTVMAGGAVPWDRLAWAGALDVVYLGLTLGLYAWALGYARRHGKLSRFGD